MMTKCAELLNETTQYLNIFFKKSCNVYRIDFIDINMGCPIDIIYNKGYGSALLESPRKMEDIIVNMNKVISVPLTFKIRTGKEEKFPTGLV